MIKVQILDSSDNITDTIEVDPYRCNRIMGKWRYLDQIEAALIQRCGEEIAKENGQEDFS